MQLQSHAIDSYDRIAERSYKLNFFPPRDPSPVFERRVFPLLSKSVVRGNDRGRERIALFAQQERSAVNRFVAAKIGELVCLDGDRGIGRSAAGKRGRQLRQRENSGLLAPLVAEMKVGSYR